MRFLFTFRWQFLVDVQNWQRNYPRVDRRLIKKHLELDNYSKMNVRTAVDVFSEAIEEVMIELDSIGSASKYDLLNFLKLYSWNYISF